MMKSIIIGVVIIGAVLAGGYYWTLNSTKSHSPADEVTLTSGGLAVTVRYSRPYKKGREIFGGLVPYGEVWRTGANEATTIAFSQAIRVAGEDLPAGRYALFTIPNKDQWTIIFNETADQWGAFDYNAAQDALRVEVTPQQTAEMTEQFTISLDESDGDIRLNLDWDTTRVSVPIEPA